MQGIKFCKIIKRNTILLHPIEYKWITNMLNMVNKNPHIKQDLLSGCHDIPNLDNHSSDTMTWTIEVTKYIMKHDCKIKKHILGDKSPFSTGHQKDE